MKKMNNLVKQKDYLIYLVCLLSFVFALLYNSVNLHHLPVDYQRGGQTVITNDDISYLNPPTSYLKTNVWQEDYWGGKVGYFLRPPGYGLLYMVFLKMADNVTSLWLLKLFQVLLFSISVFWFNYIALKILKNKNFALFLSLVYGCSPFAIGFLFYTLTEAIIPALLLGFIYFLYRGFYGNNIKAKKYYYLIACAFFSYLFIVRPVLGIFGLLIPVFLYKDDLYMKGMRLITWLVLYLAVALSLMTIWQVRNYNIAGKYVGLHPIYYEDNNTVYRAPFREFWNFAGGWAERGDQGFSYMMPLWEAAITGDTSIAYVNDAIAEFPPKVFDYFGKARLTAVFRKYQEAILEQKTYYDKQLPMPMQPSEAEADASKGFRKLTDDFKSHFWFTYHIVSPVKVFILMTFHSNLSLYIFQKTYRGTFIMETVRLIFYSLHGLCFLLLLVNVFLLLKKDTLTYFTTVIIPLIYVFYLCYIQRGIEERYTLPILPLLIIGVASSFSCLYLAIIKGYSSKK
jgi:hypothetical protein